MNKTNKVQCGKAHSGSKTLTKTARSAWECSGCGQCYTMAQVAEAKTGQLAGRGLPYIVG